MSQHGSRYVPGVKAVVIRANTFVTALAIPGFDPATTRAIRTNMIAYSTVVTPRLSLKRFFIVLTSLSFEIRELKTCCRFLSSRRSGDVAGHKARTSSFLKYFMLAPFDCDSCAAHAT